MESANAGGSHIIVGGVWSILFRSGRNSQQYYNPPLHSKPMIPISRFAQLAGNPLCMYMRESAAWPENK